MVFHHRSKVTTMSPHQLATLHAYCLRVLIKKTLISSSN